MNLIHHILNILSNPLKSPAPAPQAQPAHLDYNRFLMQPNRPPSGDYQFTPTELPATPVKFEIKLPKNTNPLQGYSLYGDTHGNTWFENDKTGQRLPIPPPRPQYDVPIPPSTGLTPGHFPQATFPVQPQSPGIFTPPSTLI